MRMNYEGLVLFSAMDCSSSGVVTGPIALTGSLTALHLR